MPTFAENLQALRENYSRLKDLIVNENIDKLVTAVRKNIQTAINHEYLNSLTASTILQNISFYASNEKSNRNSEISNKEKLLLVFSLHHNYAWRLFVELYHSEEEDKTGGLAYSQNPLITECAKMLKRKDITAKMKKSLKLIFDEIEVIRDGLDDLKIKITENVESLKDHSQIARELYRDIIGRMYIQSVIFDNEEFLFKYKGPFSLNRLPPETGATLIDYVPLREIIDNIFKIKKSSKKQKADTRSDLSKGLWQYYFYYTICFFIELISLYIQLIQQAFQLAFR